MGLMTSNPFDLNNYDFELPEELIAQKPVEPRDQSRLLVINRKEGTWEHRTFRDLPEYLDSRDLLIANNTQVFKARLEGHRMTKPGEHHPGGKVEMLLLEEHEPLVWEGAFHASAKHKPGLKFEVPTPDGKKLIGEIVRGASESPSGTVWARFDRDPISAQAGVIPLPHYIKRDQSSGSSADDLKNYQTVYAKNLGSAAAPTAGLHFTPELMKELRARGAEWREVTLHVGLGTFRPVKTDDIRQHVMHEERYEVPDAVANEVNAARKSGERRILAVGTTSVRTLESAWQPGTGLRSGWGRSSLFIYPEKHQFQVVDRMITNFHLPKSTLFILVCAFAGTDLMKEAYASAIQERYRFFSYGDGMLIL